MQKDEKYSTENGIYSSSWYLGILAYRTPYLSIAMQLDTAVVSPILQ